MHRLFLVAAACLLATPAAAEDVTSSIVKIYTTYQRAHWSRPWQMQGSSGRSGSGCIIEGSRILTNAHVVSDATFIQVRRAGSPDKFVAKVQAISHELDLAILVVENLNFFQGATPLRLGELPAMGDTVVAYGFPKGGTRVTITRGIVSRTERDRYSHSGHRNLVCQIDAAINSGSSGGPLLDAKNRIAGVAFQSGRGQNVGYMIPAPVVAHFFEDLKDGRVDGAPLLPLVWQFLQNPSMRAELGLADGRSGVVIRRVLFGGEAAQVGDVLYRVGEFPVGNDGTIEFRPRQRVGLSFAIDRQQVGSKIQLHLLRDGKEITVDVPLKQSKMTYPYLVHRYRYEVRPSYYIIGGLVFSRLTSNYISVWDEWSDAPQRLTRHWYERRTDENAWRKDIVVCIDVLPDELNVGYTWAEDYVVERINGKRIAQLSDVVDAFDANTEKYHTIQFERRASRVVLDREQTAQRSPEILRRYRVPADRSADLAKK
ncbi:MAG: trypsin-like peptidase domain-containing protein [Planctomycetota bacterium]